MRALDFVMIKLCRLHSQTNKVLSSNFIYVLEIHHMIKESLQIPKGLSEAVDRRRTDNTKCTMDKKTRGRTNNGFILIL